MNKDFIDFVELVDEKLNGLQYRDIVHFAWLCSVRSLPFLGATGNFDFWRKNVRKEYLLIVLRVIDSAVVAINDIPTYDSFYKTSFVSSFNSSPSLASIMSNTCTSAYDVIRTICDTRVSALYGSFIYDVEPNSNIEASYSQLRDSTRAAAMDSARSANNFDVDLKPILIQDLLTVASGTTLFNSSIDVYNDIWNNFQKALNEEGGIYWSNWYKRLFENGLLLYDEDIKEITQRLNISNEMQEEGATAVAEYMMSKSISHSVFLSYCHADSDLADIIDSFMCKHQSLRVTRDIRDVRYTDSFKVFMQTIGKHDYVVMLISDNFLKSKACMYEVGELIATRNLENKLLFVIVKDEDSIHYKQTSPNSIGANIYNSIQRNEYIAYWENQYIKEENSISQIKSDSAKIEPLKKLRELRKIIDHDISPFLDYLSDANGKSFSEMYKVDFQDILLKIKQ